MWRAFFLAVGVYLCILGGECMVVEKAVFANSAAVAVANSQSPSDGAVASSKEFSPPEWMPWSLVSVGAVVILYSFTIPRRVSG